MSLRRLRSNTLPMDSPPAYSEVDPRDTVTFSKAFKNASTGKKTGIFAFATLGTLAIAKVLYDFIKGPDSSYVHTRKMQSTPVSKPFFRPNTPPQTSMMYPNMITTPPPMMSAMPQPIFYY